MPDPPAPAPPIPPEPSPPPGLPLYPLAVGHRWTYRVTVEYFGLDQKLHRWKGTVVDEVTAVERDGEAWIFTVQRGGLPEEPAATEHVILLADRLYEFAADWDHAPFLAGTETDVGFSLFMVRSPRQARRWGAFADDPRGEGGDYAWVHLETRSIKTPAGRFTDCERVTLRTMPDHSEVTYCPGVGMVRREYVHHGTVREETWVLTSFTRGAP